MKIRKNIFSCLIRLAIVHNATICNVRLVSLTLKSNNFCEDSPTTRESK